MSGEGRPFVDPPWQTELDVGSALAGVPADGKISGMFFVYLVTAAKAQGVELPTARERYVQFSFYPVAELAHLLVEGAQRLFPGRTLRHALRTLGRASPDAFLASTLGKVTLGSTEGVHPAIAAMAKGYELNVRPSSVTTLHSGERWAIVRLDEVGHFLDSHHVGVFEGLIRFAGARGTVQIAVRSASSADFLLSWRT